MFQRGPPQALIGLESLVLDLPPLIVEGEPSLVVAREWWPHRPAITWKDGEWGAENSDWSPLAGRAVTLFPRNDDMGISVMEGVATQLQHLGCLVTFVDPSTLPPGSDLATAKERNLDPKVVLAWAQTHAKTLPPLVEPPTEPQDGREEPTPQDYPDAEPAQTVPAAATEDAYLPVPLDAISDEVRAQVVQNIFDAGAVGVLAGSPNAGKTFFAVHLGVHVAAGEPWFGAKVAQGPVIYVAAEAPGSVKSRAKLAAAHSFPDRRLPFYVVSAAPGLGDEAHYLTDTGKLIGACRQVASTEGSQVRMIIIDTVASVLGDGEENADGMLRLASSCKHLAMLTDAAVILVHHPSKSDPAGLRGHSSLQAAVDAILAIETDKATGIRTATLTKSRDSAAGRQVFFDLLAVKLPGLDFFGDERTSCVVVGKNVPESQRKRPQGRAQESLLVELERQHRAGVTSWDRAQVIAAAKGIGQKRTTAGSALYGLLKGGFVSGSDASLSLRHPPEG